MKILWVSLGLILLGAPLAGAQAGRDYLKVDTEDLRTRPQHYWARGIVFTDELLTRPGSETLRFDQRTYYLVTTRAVGSVYVDQDLRPVLNELPLNQACLFIGTVQQVGRRYYVGVTGVRAVLDTAKVSENWQSLLETAKEEGRVSRDLLMEELLLEFQQQCISYATNNRVPLYTLFDPKSDHYRRVNGMGADALEKLQAKHKTVCADIIVGFMVARLGAFYQAPETPAAAVAPVVVTNLPPVEPPLGWWGRWQKSRRERAAQRDEEARQQPLAQTQAPAAAPPPPQGVEPMITIPVAPEAPAEAQPPPAATAARDELQAPPEGAVPLNEEGEALVPLPLEEPVADPATDEKPAPKKPRKKAPKPDA